MFTGRNESNCGKKRIRPSLALLSGAILLVVLAGCQGLQNPFDFQLSQNDLLNPVQQNGCQIKIGMILENESPEGIEMLRGLDMARDEINAGGGVQGCTIQFVQKDDHGDPQEASAAARDLIHNDGISIIVGSTNNTTTLAAARICDEEDVVLISPLASAGMLSQMGYERTFRIPSSSKEQIAAVFSWLESVSDPNIPPTLAGVFRQNGSGDAAGNVFLNQAAEKGWPVVANINDYQSQNRDQLVQGLLTANPDILLVSISSYTDVVDFLRAIKTASLTPKAVINIANFMDHMPAIAPEDRDLLQDLFLVAQWSSDADWQDESGRDAQSFADDYRARYAAEPGLFSLEGYVSLMVVKQALIEAEYGKGGDVTLRLWRVMMKTDMDTLLGRIRFNDSGQNLRSPLLLQFKNGRPAIIYPEEYRTITATYPVPPWNAERQAEPTPLALRDILAEPARTQTPVKLLVGAIQSVESLNPFNRTLLYEAFCYQQIYDTMYSLSPDGPYEPLLAQRVEVSPDGTQYTFTIPEGIKFHDGMPLTAEDAAFSYRLYGLDARATDEVTLHVTLAQPTANLADQLYFNSILPKHIWEPLASDKQKLRAFENNPPIGSGPFKVTDFKKGDYIRFNANQEYWRGKPKVDEMIWQTFIGQPDTLTQALLTNQVDAFYDPPLTTLNAMKNATNVKVVSAEPLFPSEVLLYINQIDALRCPPEKGKCSGHPALRDPTVRKALSMAVDKAAITETTTFGYAKPGKTMISSALGSWFNTDLEDYAFDLAAANILLDEGGYRDNDNDGVREMPDGSNPLVFRLFYPEGRASYLFKRPAEILAAAWADLGVRLEVQSMDQSKIIPRMIPAFDYDVILWTLNSRPDPDLVLSFLYSKSANSGLYSGGYINEAYDDFYLSQARETDAMRRKEIVWQMQKILHDDAVHIVLYYLPGVYAVRTDRFTGWPFDSERVFPLDPAVLSNLEMVR